MFAVFLVLLVLASLASGPAWWNARRHGAWIAWDYASLVVPFALWLALVIVGFGPGKSLSNVVELFILAVVVPLLHSVRVFIVDRQLMYRRRNSIVVFGAANLIAIALCGLVPGLPE